MHNVRKLLLLLVQLSIYHAGFKSLSGWWKVKIRQSTPHISRV